MEEAGIVPEVIDIVPPEILKVTYPNGITLIQGSELTPTQVKDQPSLQWNAEEDGLYTILLTSLDLPKQIQDAIHWLVVNIPGNNLSKGRTVMEYAGSGPPKGTGKHRYIFLVFKQSSLIKTNVYVTKTEIDGRFTRRTRDIIKDYNLGNPVAGNFYRAEYDDYVPILHAQLK